MTRKTLRGLGAFSTGAIAALAIAATASAHVEVDVDGEAVAGQPAKLVFVVPNERDQATVSIEVQMPQDIDLADVIPAEVEDWTITTTTRDGDIVDTITWDATGPGLVGEESVALPVAVGPLPPIESLTFPTVQTYDGGEVVRWIEPAPPGEPEPDFPIPTLAITAAAPGDTTAPTEPPVTVAPTATQPATTPTEPAATSATEPATGLTDAVVDTTPADSAADIAVVAEPPDVTAPTTTVGTDDDDGAAAWPWVVAGIIVALAVGGAAFAIARRRTSS